MDKEQKDSIELAFFKFQATEYQWYRETEFKFFTYSLSVNAAVLAALSAIIISPRDLPPNYVVYFCVFAIIFLITIGWSFINKIKAEHITYSKIGSWISRKLLKYEQFEHEKDEGLKNLGSGDGYKKTIKALIPCYLFVIAILLFTLIYYYQQLSGPIICI